MQEKVEENLTAADIELPGQERYVAPLEDTPLQEVDSVDESVPVSGMWSDAWRTLRRNPLFIISAILILAIFFIALFPGVLVKSGAPFNGNPTYCSLDYSLAHGSAGHPFGFDKQGCDVYARVIYGTRTSVTIGLIATILAVLVGSMIGALAGFFGGWVDAVLSRITDIFLALPMLLGAIVVLQMFKSTKSMWKIIMVMVLFGWVSVARIARSAVMESKNLEFNIASTALGSRPARNLFRHIIPNSLAPIIVVGTTSLGSYIVLEATLSFLGIGLPTTTVSWGGDIFTYSRYFNNNPEVLLCPSIALAITVLSFIMMGDAVKDALDPKSRKA
ncbi:ABC transporter permease [Gardnerella sp. 2492-Sm]|uniref:ABC transporter permease n=1 Tax=unclassified Gardnerella TaxID=2628112 RepID=UPI003D03AB5E